MEQQYSCRNCMETYGIHDGIFCMNTTPFYQLTNCNLTIQELIDMAQEYDRTHQVDGLGEIEREVPYTDKRQLPHREELCSELATKLRKNAPPSDQAHFICSKGDNKCINSLVKEYFTTAVDYTKWNGIVPCLIRGHSCNSHYDTADLLDKVNRPTKLIIQNALLTHEKFKAHSSSSSSSASASASSGKDQKHELEHKIDERDVERVFLKCMDLLLPKCPRCNWAFIDWENCYSVKCANTDCKVDFCGVCLTFYGTSKETHDHIRTMCKKHQDWEPVNPQCNYYGSNPTNTSLLYIKVQSHIGFWIDERRKTYKDPFLEAPTLLEKVIAYLKLQPMPLRQRVVDRMFKSMRDDLKFGNKKKFVRQSLFGDREIDVVYDLDKVTPFITHITLDESMLTKKVRVNPADSTMLLSDTFFPLNLLSFMNPIDFYDILYEGAYIPSPNNRCRLVEERLRRMLSPERLYIPSYQVYPSYQRKDILHEDIIFLLFRETLVKYKAVIAGGLILSTISPHSEKEDPKQDIDLYVNLKHAKECIYRLIELGFELSGQHMAPVYDDSFMFKNNILARVAFCHGSSRHPPMDVMIIKDDTSVESVVTNFDLTICQVWYDGISVRASHWDDITSKHGSLQPEYHKSYSSGNRFIHQRIKKYVRRGFEIDTPEFVEPEKAELLDELEYHNIKYKAYLAHLGSGEDQEEIEQKIYENAYDTSILYNRMDGPKTVSPHNIEKWLVLKLYDEIIHSSKNWFHDTPFKYAKGLALLLSYPLYPITYERLREITVALHIDIRSIFQMIFINNAIDPYPPFYDRIIQEVEPLLDRLFSGKRRKTRKPKNRRKTSRTKPKRKTSRTSLKRRNVSVNNA